jgi:hypothetical protein
MIFKNLSQNSNSIFYQHTEHSYYQTDGLSSLGHPTTAVALRDTTTKKTLCYFTPPTMYKYYPQTNKKLSTITQLCGLLLENYHRKKGGGEGRRTITRKVHQHTS